MKWMQYIHSMLLDSRLYDAPIARLVDLLCITEPDHTIGCVLVCVLDGIAQSPVRQA